MPVILKREFEDEWTSKAVTEPLQLERMYEPYPADQMQSVPVSTRVNMATNNRPELILNSQ